MSKPVAAAAGALKGWRSESPSRPPQQAGRPASAATRPRLRGGAPAVPRWHWHLGWDSRAGPPRSSGALIWGPTPLHPM